MEGKKLTSVTAAFACRVRGTVLLLFAFAVGLFSVSSYRLLNRQRIERGMEEARLCARAVANLEPDKIEQRVQEVAAASAGFIGAAWVDSAGQPVRVAARSPEAREKIFSELAEAGGGRTRGTLVSQTLLGATTGELFAPGATRIVAFVETVALIGPWLGAVAVFALFLMAMTFVTIRSLRRWFDRHVSRPLKSLTVLVPNSDTVLDRSPSAPTQWKETAQIEALFRDFIERLNETDERTYRLEQEAAHRLRECEAGYNRELRRARDRATTDPLTRLRNRAFLDTDVPTLFKCHRESNQPVAAVMMDLDNFKRYNDTHGHQVGDALLRFVGGLLRGSIRPTDHALRYGGDEFLLFMPGATAANAQAVTQRLIKLFSQYTACLQSSEGLSLSAGVAAIPEADCSDVWELIACADRALYLAKSGGKNRVSAVAPLEPKNAKPARVAVSPRPLHGGLAVEPS